MQVNVTRHTFAVIPEIASCGTDGVLSALGGAKEERLDVEEAHRLHWSKVWGGIKSAYKFAKDSGVLSKLADAAVAPASAYTGNPGAVMAARQGLKSLTGIGVYDSDSVVEKEGGRLTMDDVKKGAKRALSYAKRKGILTDVVDYIDDLSSDANIMKTTDNPNEYTALDSEGDNDDGTSFDDTDGFEDLCAPEEEEEEEDVFSEPICEPGLLDTVGGVTQIANGTI
ncbi:unnamed protein product [Phytophthora fragariaefolia]|uniref:Unnamed protein product n=1 Tax=Phytophthora fragariaefolia TaxID=1490495 RepID=A0A9W6XPP0_9STRA|nr:unnamed protein product [Phytophthora fragariaefolia]